MGKRRKLDIQPMVKAAIVQVPTTKSPTVTIGACRSESASSKFVDIAINEDQVGPVEFTFFWTSRDRWEEHDYEVRIKQKPARVLAA